MCFGCITAHLYSTTELYKHYQNYLNHDEHDHDENKMISFYKTKQISQILAIAEQNCRTFLKPFVSTYKDDKISKDMIISAALYDLICEFNIVDLELIELIVNECPNTENLKLLNDLKSFVFKEVISVLERV
jgi:hypothetical protein